MLATNGAVATVHQFFYQFGFDSLFPILPGFVHPEGWSKHNGTAQQTQALIEQYGCPAYGWVVPPGYLILDADQHNPAKNGIESLGKLSVDINIDLWEACNHIAQTGGGGRHLIFRFPSDVFTVERLSAYPGLDFWRSQPISGSRYIVGAGSRPNREKEPPQTLAYEFLKCEGEIAECPAALVNLIRRPAPQNKPVETTPILGSIGDQFNTTTEGLDILMNEMSERGYSFVAEGDRWNFIRPGKSTASARSGHVGHLSDAGRYQLTCYTSDDEAFPVHTEDASMTILEALTYLWYGKEPTAEDRKQVIKRIAATGFGQLSIEDMFGHIQDEKPTPQLGEVSWQWMVNLLRRNTLPDYNQIGQKFVETVGLDVRYVPTWKKWLVWDGRRFEIDPDNVRVDARIQEFTRAMYAATGLAAEQGIDGKVIGRLVSFIRSCNESITGTKRIRMAARVHVTLDHDRLNRDPFTLNCLNGTLDLRTHMLRPHSRDDFITQLAPVRVDPAAKCPQWENTVRLAMCGDSELVRYVKQIFGYSITGDWSDEIFPIAYGSGANGKSTLWNALIEILGRDYAMLAPETLLLGDTNEHSTTKMSLFGKRFVAVSEPSEGSGLREARMKEMTGDKVITGRRCREDDWTYTRTHTFWLSTNHRPRIRGTDEGTWRRIKLIPFLFNFRNAEGLKVIKGFSDWMAENEGSGIVNWLLEGLKDYQTNGFIEPAAVKKATDKYRNAEDHIGRFLEECFAPVFDGIIPVDEMFSRYRQWAGSRAWSKRVFYEKLEERGFTRIRYKGAGMYRDRWVVCGLAFLPIF